MKIHYERATEIQTGQSVGMPHTRTTATATDHDGEVWITVTVNGLRHPNPRRLAETLVTLGLKEML